MTKDKKKARIASIDILRGFVIVIMLIDHVRGHFYTQHPLTDPMVIENTHMGLFFTRVLSHLCAPIFVFLTGISAWLYANNKNKPNNNVFSFLIKRGLFLLLLEITLVNFSWSASYHTLYLQVIWAIGISMICLAICSKLPRIWITILGFTIVFGHNALDLITYNTSDFAYNIWTIIHKRGYLHTDLALKIRVSYPILPWIGVILLGYASGPLYKRSNTSLKRKKILLYLGFSSIGLLLVLRGWNIYGEALLWEKQNTSIHTLASFLNYTKYPPSLHFLLLTLGIGFFLLYALEKINTNHLFCKILRVYGSAPMFFYIIHLYAILIVHGLLIFTINNGKPIQLNHVYQLWILAIGFCILLYYPTKKFGDYKRKSSAKLLKYF